MITDDLCQIIEIVPESTHLLIRILLFNCNFLDFEHFFMMMMIFIINKTITMGCTQIPISTLSHIWVFVRLYGIVFVIIVIIVIIIIITIIIKSEGVNAQL